MKQIVIPENPRLIIIKMRMIRNSAPEGMQLHYPEARPVKMPRGRAITRDRVCDLSQFIGELGKRYVLVDASFTDTNPGEACVRFCFSTIEHAHINLRIIRDRLNFHNYLRRALGWTLWTTDVYVNPFVQAGWVIPGVESIDINCRNLVEKGAGAPATGLLKFAKPVAVLPQAELQPAAAD